MTRRPIRALLITNRGEIATRIIRTAQRMGIETIAVFSDADEDALHVSSADRAVRIGPPPARQSYLDMDSILEAASLSGADAIHPGYGFLAENAAFAEACLSRGFVFVGPPAAAILAMGDKAKARALMASSGAPVLPGYEGNDQSPSKLASAAASIGFPVLIKATAGGGGKGMRVVEAADDFAGALQSARREAKSAFGDDRMILEQFLPHARHVEVQVFADESGRTVHLFDRDCSAQRRRQKLIEEAPAPGLLDALRNAMRETAIACAQAVSYVGAGTVEFLVSTDQFYFMEMNTRLQVEHPVTEAITGLDLVEWQLRIARGEQLPLRQQDIRAGGHAIEARICAENAEEGFLAQTGRITALRWPQAMEGVRIDSGVRQGDEVTPYYDSLLAKVVAHGADRGEALARLQAALAGSAVAGVKTNRNFLARILAEPAFVAAAYDTALVETRSAAIIGAMPRASPTVVAVAAFAALHRIAQTPLQPADPSDPFSAWREVNGWRLGGRAKFDLKLAENGHELLVAAEWREAGYDLTFGSERYAVTGSIDRRGRIAVRVNDERLRALAAFDGDRLTIFMCGSEFDFVAIDPWRPPHIREEASPHLLSPLPGLIAAVLVEAGSRVDKGTPLIVVEAMKMEHTIRAPRKGLIQAVRVGPGDQVAAGAELVVMEALP